VLIDRIRLVGIAPSCLFPNGNRKGFLSRLMTIVLILLTVSLAFVDPRLRFGSVAVYDYTIVLLWIFLVSSGRVRVRRCKRLLVRTVLPLLGIISAGLVANLIYNVDMQLVYLFKVLAGMALYLGLRLLLSFAPLRIYHLLVVILELVGSCLGLIALLSSSSGRFKGTFTDPNYFAAFQSGILCLAFALSVQKTEQGLARAWHIMCTAIIGFSIALSFSRGGYLAMAFGMITVLLSMPKKSLSKITLLLLGFGVCLGLIAFAQLPVYHRWGSRLSLHEAISSGGTGRLSIWTRGLQAVCQRPLGHGWGTERTVLGKVSHNVLLEVGIQSGLVGVILILLFLFLLFHDLMRLRRLEGWGVAPGLLGAVVATLVASMFVNALLSRHFWYMLALANGAVDATFHYRRTNEMVSSQGDGKFNG